MKKLLILFSMCAIFIASDAAAQFSGPGQRRETTTTDQARRMVPGRYVTLEGNIVSHIREDYYLFRDASGEIRVQIESQLWQGREVNPNTRVRLRGEVDTSIRGRYIWVEAIQIIE
ncbi:MAG TPA: hypothetical protein DCM62_05100 [Bacteroidales bacterium]|nr:hypothetical protein [Bacteroidales bacterium]